MSIQTAAIEWYQKELLSIMKEETFWAEHLPGQWEMEFEGKKYRCQPYGMDMNKQVLINIEEIKSTATIIIDVGHRHYDNDGNVTHETD